LSRAIELEPTNGATYHDRGQIKQAIGDATGAVDDFTRAIKNLPRLASAYYGRGIERAAARDNSGALADFEMARDLDSSSELADYARFYIWLTESRRGARGQATGELRKFVVEQKAVRRRPWVVAIGEFLIGDRDEVSLLSAADAAEPRVAGGQRCEAFFFAGAVRLLDGRRAAAVEMFRKSVETQEVYNTEHRSAVAELAGLK
jgi:lipoprotein NlpI